MATVIVPTLSEERCGRLLESLVAQDSRFETIVIDNREPSVRSARPIPGVDDDSVRVLEPDENLGFSAAANLGASEARGEILILLNDDCTVEPGFVSAMVEALDPEAGVVMAAGVMKRDDEPGLIDSAGIELDKTLLGFDYLSGEAISVIDRQSAADPVGPSGVAAAYDREEFLAVGGFDENLFAYWEDVDLALRMRQRGGRCRLVSNARGTHAHSATLGAGSSKKNRLMGFGRGYMLRKWSVLQPVRLPAVAAREIPICLGQVVMDRNLAGISGRLQGLRARAEQQPYPSGLPDSVGLMRNLLRRLERRRTQSS